MNREQAFKVIKQRYVTEKCSTLENLKNSKSNASLARCESPKYVFIVDKDATKQEIAMAIEEIYSGKKVKVTAVNTINVKAKPTRRIRSFGKTEGKKTAFKKAIVTLEANDSIE